MKRIIKYLLATTVIISLFSGCVATRVKVCSTVYPIQYLLERIGGNRIDTCSISNNTQVTRSSLSSSYRTDLNGALTVFYAGEVEPYMQIYSNELLNSGYELYDATSNANLYLFKRYNIIKTDTEFITVESDYYPDTTLFDDVDIYTNDPYVWLDPITYTSMARTITDYLIQKSPLDENYFNSNYEELENELAVLDSSFQTLKNGVTPKVVTVTPSFGNWQKSYGVEIYPTIMSKYGVVPNAEQQKFLYKYIEENNVKYIAYEPGLPDDIKVFYDKLVSDLGLKPVTLYNLTFITEEQQANGDDYLSLMKANLRSLKEIIGE